MWLIEIFNNIVWGMPTLIVILAVGIYIGIRTRFVQVRMFGRSLRIFLRKLSCGKGSEDGLSSYQALCTALAATVGTGNIIGVAGAICIGGPGAVFWLWVCGLLGMGVKFAEATLAVRYRHRNDQGEYIGGPMYMIENAMPRWRWLAVLYCFFGVIATFGVGNATQINAIIGSANSVICYLGGAESQSVNLTLGVILAVLVMLMLRGGAKQIGQLAERLVPYAAVGYILLCLLVIIGRWQAIPNVFRQIIIGAFSPSAMTGGAVGAAFTAMRVGASRGVFTNEAGMGTASIAHAASNVKHPVEQGMMGIMEVFIDTIVICTMTAVVILCSGVPVTYGVDVGVTLSIEAFSNVLGDWVCIPLMCLIICFSIATVLGWGFYGARCAQYLFGEDVWKRFIYMQAVIAVVSAVLGSGIVWLLAESVNGLMTIPNLVVLLYLTPEVSKLLKHYTLTKCIH